MALSLEGGDLAQSEHDLREAQRKLREALARGADEQEIAKLTDELREAMEKFLQGMSEQAARQRDPDATRAGKGEGAITKEDLDKMLDEWVGPANRRPRAGAKAARRFRGTCWRISSRRKAAAKTPARGKAAAPNSTRCREISNSCATRLSGRGAGRKIGGEPATRTRRAEERQHALRERLEREREALRRSGEGAPTELDDADKAMKDAEQALGQGQSGAGKAVDAQGRALQALRRGADELARRGEQEGGAGQESGQDERGQPAPRARARTAIRSAAIWAATANATPIPVTTRWACRRRNAPAACRRGRRQLGQPERPAEELDYLQRLLRR